MVGGGDNPMMSETSYTHYGTGIGRPVESEYLNNMNCKDHLIGFVLIEVLSGLL